MVAALLKSPHRLTATLAAGKDLVRSSAVLLVSAIVCHAIFGAAMGMFQGPAVAAMDAVKVPLVAAGSLFLCFPSLYIFASVGGSPLSLSQTFMMGCSCLAMSGLLLVGLAPVAWLFAVSTESLPFMVFLTLTVWLIATAFAARYVGRLRTNPLFQRQLGIKLWFVILAAATLQMTTCMRPMLAEPGDTWRAREKMFFLSHFGSAFAPKPKKDAPSPTGDGRPGAHRAGADASRGGRAPDLSPVNRP